MFRGLLVLVMKNTKHPLSKRSSVVRRRRATLVAVGALLVAAFGLTFTAMASAHNDSLRVRTGSIGEDQSIDALAVQDQEGTVDDWDNYVEFIPEDGTRHDSVMRIEPQGTGGASLTADVNFRGPEGDENLWTVSVRDIEARAWVEVFSNEDTESWVWSSASTTLDDSARFVNSRGSVWVRYQSANDFDVSQLDYVGLTLSGDHPDPTVPTTIAPTTTTMDDTTTTTVDDTTTTTMDDTTTTTMDDTTTTTSGDGGGGDVQLPPSNAGFDYQIGGAYEVPSDAGVVSRDWEAEAAPGVYNVCYINAFQTQGNYGGTRPDESQNWPSSVVLRSSEDPNWPGEFLIDISTTEKQETAAAHLQQLIDICADKGFDAIEYDNLDSWTRLPNLPFDQRDTVSYATMITERAHDAGLAVAHKNTTDLIASGDHETIGFDFAIAEECGQWDECDVFVSGYGSLVMAVEYSTEGFAKACSEYGDQISIIRRNVDVSSPSSGGYVRETC